MFLTEAGVETPIADKYVVLLGATNLPWDLDEAMKRRFEQKIYIPLPKLDDRIDIMKKMLAKKRNRLTEEDFRDAGKSTEGYTSDDINKLMNKTFRSIENKCLKAKCYIKIDEKLFEPTYSSNKNGI